MVIFSIKSYIGGGGNPAFAMKKKGNETRTQAWFAAQLWSVLTHGNREVSKLSIGKMV